MSEEDQTMQKALSNQNPSSTSNPSWLLPTVVDVEDRMRNLVTNSTNEEEGDTFAERAEWYYQRRPQLLSLLKDLYNGYVTLLDRYQQAKGKHYHYRRCSNTSGITSVDDCLGEGECSQLESSDTESTVSYQPPTMATAAAAAQNDYNIDELIAELVSKSVENEMLRGQVSDMDQMCIESGRKIELLKKLIELLESERVILMSENAKLGYKVRALVEENKELASEAIYVKRKAADLARVVVRMREDHRVCMLSDKIEDLQEQIYGLEKRNKEYYQMLVKMRGGGEYERSRSRSTSWSLKEKCGSTSSRSEVGLEGLFGLEKVGGGKWKKSKAKSASWGSTSVSIESDSVIKQMKKESSKWWVKVKNVDLFSCGVHPRCN